MDLHVAAVQMDARPYAVAENVAHAQALVEQAAQRGAQLVVLPEVFNTGYHYSDRNFEVVEPLDGPTGSWVVETARRLDIHLVGTFPARIDGEAYITSLLAAPDGRTWHYRKNHVAHWENLYFRRGRDVCVAETDIGRIGFVICWDTVFADMVRRYRDRVDLLCISSSPPNLGRGLIRTVDGRDVLDLRAPPQWQEMARRGYRWFFDGTRQHARVLGVPVVHALRCGTFASPLPWPLLAVPALSPGQWWPFWWETRLRFVFHAPLMAHSLICDGAGQVLASLDEEEAAISASVQVVGPQPGESLPVGRFIVPDMIGRLALLDSVLIWLGPLHYRRHRRRGE